MLNLKNVFFEKVLLKDGEKYPATFLTFWRISVMWQSTEHNCKNEHFICVVSLIVNSFH